MVPQPAAAFGTAQPIFVISSCCPSLAGPSDSAECLLRPGRLRARVRMWGCERGSGGVDLWLRVWACVSLAVCLGAWACECELGDVGS
jgi:hypothetical protein